MQDRYLLRPMAALSLLLSATTASADPWLAPGDVALRHDIELLADEGIIRSPVTTWPMSWPDIARDVNAASQNGYSAGVEQALSRVQRAARQAAAPGFSGLGFELSAAEKPTLLRTYSNTPRDPGELAVGGSWLGERFAAAVKVTGVADPSDDQDVRLDGSYVGVTLANFMISAGATERWWGPGWDGSLILSNNARPIPGITIERNYTDASKWPVFKWFGPWRASIAVGRAEGKNVAVPNTRFLAARVNFKPRPWLEFGLSRTAQWCGDGRPCGWGTLQDLLIGNDNQGGAGGVSPNDEPGNQMAGYDMRLRSPWKKLPLAGYVQFIGEDEAGGLPSKFLGLVGGETWFDTAIGSVRLRAEFADSACTFTRSDPDFNCAYRNSLYPQGYTYRGRIIGHSMDQDGRMVSAAATLVRPQGDSFHLLLREVKLNRDGSGGHAISPGAASDLQNVELEHRRDAFGGSLTLGLGYDSYDSSLSLDSGVRAFARYQRGF